MILAAANPSLDSLFEVAELREGEIHRPESLWRVAGGKALNAARAAHALGAAPEVVALLGRRGGELIVEGLAAEGVPLHPVWTAGELRSCLSVFDRDSGRLTEFYERGSALGRGDWERFAAALLERCASGRCLALCGSLPPGVEAGAYRELVAAAVHSGAAVAVDAGGATLAAALEAGPELVKVNLEEARGLLGAELGATELARRLRQELGGSSPTAVVTAGAAGAVLAAGEGTVRARTPALSGASFPVGSGDAFMAGLLVARERGEGWDATLRQAVAAGAANAELQGAGRLDPERATSLARAAAVEWL